MNPRNKANHPRALPRNITLVGNHPAQPDDQISRPRDPRKHINHLGHETNQPALARLIRTAQLVHPSALEISNHKKILNKPRRRTSLTSNPEQPSFNQIGQVDQPRTWRTWSCQISSLMLKKTNSNLQVQAPVRHHFRLTNLRARQRQIFNPINTMEKDMAHQQW